MLPRSRTGHPTTYLLLCVYMLGVAEGAGKGVNRGAWGLYGCRAWGL